jgi:threonine dehydratase
MATPAYAGEIRPTLAVIQAAREFLAGYFSPTRLVEATSLSRVTGKRVHLKLETELPTASFKVRGAMWALAEKLKTEAVAEVVASSTGNHGAAVAYAGQKLGVKATIFLPENCNPVKRDRIAKLGATIVERGKDITDAFEEVKRYAKERSAYFLNDATDPVLPAGPGTIGMEILEQAPDTQAIYVPMGDTALIRGIAAAARQISTGVRIVGVQAERAPAYALSWRHGEAICTETCDSIADGLATRTTFAENVLAIRELVDDVVLVSEGCMLDAIGRLLFEEQVLAEPSGAATTAALLSETKIGEEKIALVVSGANLSKDVLRQVVAN